MTSSKQNLLVNPGELRKMVGRSDLVLVDTRSSRAYGRSHIHGAVNLEFFAYHWADTSPRGLKAFQDHTQRILSFAGIDNERTVVFYDQISGTGAARGVWILNYLGHSKAVMLDGGYNVWIKSGFPVDSEPVQMKPASFKVKLQDDLIASYQHVLERLGKDGVSIVDTRSPLEVSGTRIRAARGGYIPHAVKLHWKRNLNKDGTFKDEKTIRTMYQRIRVTDKNEVITYCQGGYRAAHTYVALKQAGYQDVRNYLGSWFEWGNMLELPVESPKRKS